MESLDIEKRWSSFIEKFPFTDKCLDTIVGCCQKDNIDPKVFANNFFFLTGKKVDSQEVSAPTKSISHILKYIPPTYSIFFVAAYPDVVIWFMNNYETENQKENIYFNEFKTNPTKYLDIDKTMNYKFVLLCRVAYIKSPEFLKFECSL